LCVWTIGPTSAPAQEPAKDKAIAAAAKAVNAELDRLKATGFVMQEVKDGPVSRAFPKHVFFGVYFRQHPVARLAPKGMNSANVYAVGPDGKAQLMKDAAQLQGFFKTNLAPAKEDDPAKDAARTYLRLMEELHQDGFYKFALQDDSTKVEAGKDGKNARARAVVMAGGNGELSATLTFAASGELKTIADSIRLKPGPRPICQATKLLDADPMVRRMAEGELLIMGRSAHWYLSEQRAKAPPELQRAIDILWERIVQEDR
jgi:hypothetical protein